MNRFKRVKYPDGQISAKYDPPTNPLYFNNVFGPPPPIAERINSYEDLFYVRAISDIIQNMGISRLDIVNRLFIPCMFGQRSDRRFDRMQSFDLKLIADIINECNFEEVEIFDPHSDVVLSLINRSYKRSSINYVTQAVEDIFDKKQGPLVLISPDAGAYKKVFEYGQTLDLEVLAAVKHRGYDGNVNLTFTGDVAHKNCLIVDDLCDGGFTFTTLAEELYKRGALKIFLYVSHGIFSKGFTELSKRIDHIYTTNSVKDIDFTGENEVLKQLITQFKVI